MAPAATERVNRARSARAAPGCVTVRGTRPATRPQGHVGVRQGRPEPDVTSTARPTSTDQTARRPASVTTGHTVTIETAAAPVSTVGSASHVKKVDPYASQREVSEETRWRKMRYSSSSDGSHTPAPLRQIHRSDHPAEGQGADRGALGEEKTVEVGS